MLIKIAIRLFRQKLHHIQHYSTKNAHNCVISTRRSKLNHYTDSVYDNLELLPLVAKGWNHSKSKGDYFTINAQTQKHIEERVSFKELGISQPLIEALATRNIKNATNLQYEVNEKLKNIDERRNLLVAAETGCGKTYAYLLPLIQKLAIHVKYIKDKNVLLNSPRLLVLVPNRELAYQVGDMATLLADSVALKVKVLVGGRTKKLMMDPVFEEIDVLVATPGAVGKLSAVGIYRLDGVEDVVFDEADTLLDDSFLERIGGILRRMPRSRVVLVSATMPKVLPDILATIEENMEEVNNILKYTE